MPNFERYGALHNEIMTRLENGEITTETAKEVIDAAFDKYVVEKVKIELLNPFDKKRYEKEANEFNKIKDKWYANYKSWSDRQKQLMDPVFKKWKDEMAKCMQGNYASPYEQLDAMETINSKYSRIIDNIEDDIKKQRKESEKRDLDRAYHLTKGGA